MDWDDLVRRRVRDAARRSAGRGCPESADALFAPAKALLERQKFKCVLCGTRLATSGPSTASLDRVFSSVRPSPVRGGESCRYLRNMRWTCWACNHASRHCHMRGARFRDTECK